MSHINSRKKTLSGFFFIMKRENKVYIYTYFAPCMLMVITSWISFTINYDAVPGRLFWQKLDPVKRLSWN